MTATVVITCAPCIMCGKSAVIEVNREGYQRWRAGEFVQHAFPELDADQRELLVSGTHPQCWEQLFGGEE